MNIEDFNGLDIELVFKDHIKETCEQLANNIRQASLTKFKGKGDYANSWTYKLSNTDAEGVVYNKEHYRLTHLLENGHISANGYGKGYKVHKVLDRVAPKPHIKPEFDKMQEEFIKKISSCEYKIKSK